MYRYSRLLYCIAGRNGSLQLQVPASTITTATRRISVPCFNTIRSNSINPIRLYCTPPPSAVPPAEKQSMYQKLKKWTKDYWYIVIPVHVSTSVLWLGGFYQAIRSGFEAKKIVEYLGFNNNAVIERLIKSGAGDFALTYAMFKIATPARYTLTLGCSTLLINYMKKRGYIKTAKEISKPARDLLQKKKEKIFGNKPPPSPKD